MKIIDEEFTLGDHAILRARLGLVLISCLLGNDGRRVAVVQYYSDFPSVFYGDGDTEAEALNDALVKGEAARQEHRERARQVPESA